MCILKPTATFFAALIFVATMLFLWGTLPASAAVIEPPKPPKVEKVEKLQPGDVIIYEPGFYPPPTPGTLNEKPLPERMKDPRAWA